MPNVTHQETSAAAECRVCGEVIDTDALECPLCGAVQEFTPRRRAENNRPRREVLREVRSESFNGLYKVYRNSDGTLSCSCPSFMKGNGEPAGALTYACKHIRRIAASDGQPPMNGAPPTEWQETALRKLGIAHPSRLTNAQGYFLIRDILDYQGASYREYERILRDHGKVSVLPILPVGVEFEGYVSTEVGRRGLCARFTEAGLPAIESGYTHDQMLTVDGLPMYKLLPDASIRREEGWEQVEIVTPKLFGATGFEKIHKALSVWRDAGARINASTGCHVHIDAYSYEDRHLIELMKLWAKIESRVLWYLVSPSRRMNTYCLPVTADFIRRAARNGATSVTRYLSLNVAAWGRYKTVEFRLHQGTTSGRKIVPWIVFLMKLTEAIRNGLTHRDVEPELSSVFNAIGMDTSATGRITRAREYLTQRHDWWRRDAENDPSHNVQAADIDLDAVERDIERIVSEPRRTRTQIGEEILRRRTTIRALSQERPSYRYEMVIQEPDAENYPAPMVRGNGTYSVTRHGGDVLNEDDSLTCSCASFRRRGFCAHAINIAHYLMNVIEARRAEQPSAAAAGR